MIMELCIDDAKHLDDDLYPVDCIDILLKHYGKRLDIMKPITVFKKVCDLMDVLVDFTGDEDCERLAVEAVNDWIDS